MNLQPSSFLQEGKYKIEKVLGQGGFGITYLAVQTGLNREVAIKEFFMKDYCERNATSSEVLLSSQGNKDIVERFQTKFIKEAQIIAQMDSPYIIRIHDIFKENSTAYYVMEYIDGNSLELLIKEKGKLDTQTALIYLQQISEALDYVHQKKILHLDIKPSNILLRHGKNAVLIDFGISKRYDDTGSQTSTTPTGISKGYAPIEQYKQGGMDTFMPSTDIYSLGAVLYKLLTGETPPEASDIVDEGLIIPSDIPPLFASVIETSMTPMRKRRPQSISEFLSLLKIKQPQKPEEEITIVTTQQDDTVIQPSIAKHDNILTINTKGVSFEMCLVEGGSFIMGATPEQTEDAYNDERPTKKINIKDFYLGKTVVTQKLWKAVMKNNPSNFNGENLPVEKVSWTDCMSFIKELNHITGYSFRLPTEEEWEYAARGGKQTNGYKYAGSNNIDEVAWYDKNSDHTPHGVAMRKPNELGIYDMSGNIQEWCISYYEQDSNRVVRGGCYFSSPRRCRVSSRNFNSETYSSATIGLRLSLTPNKY